MNITGGDGSCRDKAVVINAVTEQDGVAFQRLWMKENYPGWTPVTQRLIRSKAKTYDRVLCVENTGKTKGLWFDVTSWYGR